jgi:serine protease AprX
MGKTIASRLACATVTLALVAAIGAGGSWGASRPEASAGADGYSIGSTTLYTGAQAWWDAGYTGCGVDVAVIDSGVAPVAGLDAPGKVVHGPDLSLESQAPNLTRLDTFGHGTFMAGLIVAAGGGYRGMAPGARIVSLKVATADGGADVSQVIAAIDWVVQHAHDPA